MNIMKNVVRHSQGGFTLVEVLVAVIIFAFGLLGSAGLMLSSMQSTQYSSNSMVASAMAREYGELMQMIPAAVAATFAEDNALMIDSDDVSSSASANACTGTSKNCDPNDWLEALRDDWALRIKSTQSLPQGRAEVCRDSSPHNAAGELEWGGCDDAGDTVIVKIGWLGKQAVQSNDSAVDTSWMTADRPRFAMSLMGNLRDYVAMP